MKYIEAQIINGMLEVKTNGSWKSTGWSAIESDFSEIKENSLKDIVKQAIKLKASGFTGQEIIAIIGEL